MDYPAARDTEGRLREIRIIGLELRRRDGYTGEVEEIALIPCDVRLPVRDDSRYGPPAGLNCTVHLSTGDSNFPVDANLPPGA